MYDVFVSPMLIFTTKLGDTKENTVKIMLGEGDHEVDGDEHKCLVVTCNNVTFTGRGSSRTTVRGGFSMTNRMNVFFEHLNVTNPQGSGFIMAGGETNVEVLECTVKKCLRGGMLVGYGATVIATRCDFMENGTGAGVFARNPKTTVRLNDCTMHHTNHGLAAADHAVVDLHGENTDIHSNTRIGIYAYRHGKVQIHLPSQHNTSHDNGNDGDRHEFLGGTITNVIHD